jgi:XTP/dITP diphosphohydrolase
MKLVLASSNQGKLAELRDLLGDADIDLHAQSEFGVEDAEETGLTFVENAILKARHASRATGLPALGDDSGLCVDALNGAPGLYSARYSGVHGDNAANIAKLLDMLRDVPEMQRSARFVCVLAMLRHADDPQPLIAQGVWEGRILFAPRGDGGFGYDPVFFDPDVFGPDVFGPDVFGPRRGMGAAELEASLKNRISHRGRALAQLRETLLAAVRPA